MADKMEDLLKTINEDMVDLGKKDDSKFNVLNHGDSWTSNMLFQYHSHSDTPIGFK